MSVGMAFRQVRHEWARAVATGSSILLAVTSFVVLTGSAEQTRLDAKATVDANFRSSYDVLVRPKGSQTALERDSGLVRPNYLSGLYGGITLAQADQVAKVAGVELAAPIAMIGQTFQSIDVPVNVTDLVQSGGPQVLRFSTAEQSRNGHVSTPGPAGYVYVGDGLDIDMAGDGPVSVVEQTGGKKVPLCWEVDAQDKTLTPFSAQSVWSAQCWDRSSGLNALRWPDGSNRVTARVRVSFPVTVAAVDPVAEAKLAGLDKAMVSGRFLSADDKPAVEHDHGMTRSTIPVLTTSTTVFDQTDVVKIERLDAAAVAKLRTGLSRERARQVVTASTGTPVRTATITAQDAYGKWRGEAVPTGLFRVGPVDYTRAADGSLTPKVVENDPRIWATRKYVNVPFAPVPLAASDTSFRSVSFTPAVPGANSDISLSSVGMFDPAKLTQSSALSKVPLETYQPPTARPADEATRALLGGKDLSPDTNPAGYLQAPPLMVAPISALPAIADSNVFLWADERMKTAPISVVRVRVKDVHGADAASRERIRLVAERIQQATGLEVDITVGSSPHPTTVHLPATKHGAPVMAVTENWVQKGVAATVVSAVDRKSMILFALILAATALAVSISANAAVRARRTELGVLACIGWRPVTLLRHVLAELIVVAAVAGILGALVSVPIAAALATPISWGRAAAAIPAALVLALAAGLAPAILAARSTPITAVRPAVTGTPRLRIPLKGTASLAASSLARTPARTLTAATALALGLTALTALLGIVVGFQGQVVGTLLGDAIAVQVRSGDIVAAVVLTLIGLTALLDVLFLDLKENATHYASLQAAGWRDTTMTRLIVWQGAIIAAIGTLLGAIFGLALVAYLAGLTPAVLALAAAIAVAGIAATCLLALLPARRLRRLPTALLLSRD